jgi:DNA-binding HxlR family transcriptional regulator
MEKYKTSGNSETFISKMMEDIEYDKRILFTLKNIGPQRFSDLNDICKMSKSSLSKYLKLHLQKQNIEKKIHDKAPHYFLTGKGIETLNEDRPHSEEQAFYINEINSTYIQATELIEFYKKIGVEF